VISVTIIEDDVELKDLWGGFLNAQRGVIYISSYANCEDALLHLETDKPDVILMDITLDGRMCGIEGVRRVKQILPETQVIMVTVNDDDDSVFDSLCAGAGGYLIKNISLEQLYQAVLDIKNGAPPLSMSVAAKIVNYFNKRNAMDELTERESQVLKELSCGQGQKQIADHLQISINTVKFHVKNIYRKLNVKNAPEAVNKINQANKAKGGR
jgi:DNA-binding NarL/FixJ family response regulator